MKKIIISTTINPVTEAIQKFDAMKDWQLVVIGDKKTPTDYKLTNGIYVTPQMQEDYDKELSDAIGWNCIQRRNFGLLWAFDLKADVVALVDDDNIPLANWGQDLCLGKKTKTNYYETTLLAFDPVGATNHKSLWHRGFPIQFLADRRYDKKISKEISADVQADFWNGDPDIDAICRMEHRPQCDFDTSCFPIAANKISPFNSQNTFIKGELLKNYFLFPHVGRMDDIWASFYVQALGAKVIYAKPSVFQERNIHDLTVDMKKEYLGYENNFKMLADLAVDAENIHKYLPEKTREAFSLYKKHFR